MNDTRPTLAAAVREQLGLSWEKARERCRRGQVTVDGEVVVDPAFRLREGAVVNVDEGRPRVRAGHLDPSRILYLDRDVVGVDTPAGTLTMPYEGRSHYARRSDARDAQARQRHDPDLAVVQRLDKGTSGIRVRAIARGQTRPSAAAPRAKRRTHLHALVYGGRGCPA